MYKKPNNFKQDSKKIVYFKAVFVTLLLITSMLLGVVMIPADEDNLLSKYERGDRQFQRAEISDFIVYSHKRMIDDAIVEKDYIVYQFNKNTKELIDKKIHWREDLPEHLPSIISKEQAESLAQGEVEFSRLVYISPESEIYKIDPTPQNPCWIVRCINKYGELIEIVVDSITGEILGNGVPPPYNALAIGGPDHGSCAEYYYDPYALNAQSWFNTMGYSTEALDNPDEPLIQAHISNCETALFYELCHGDSYGFRNDCTGDQSITSAEVATWIQDYTKMPFAFIGSCAGLVNTGPGTFSDAFRKGEMTDTVTVGYNHMSYGPGDPWDCTDAWSNALAWQTALFGYLSSGWTIEEAYNQACIDYAAANCGTCMKFFGDPDLTLVPVLERGELPPTTTKTVGNPKYNDDSYVSYSTKITLDAEDVCSGVKEIHYKINGIETVSSSDPVEFYFTSEGTKNLEFWAVDNNDNEELPHHIQTHYVDNTAPTSTIEFGNPFYNDGSIDWITSFTNIYLNATDGGPVPCGVKEVHWRYNGGSWYTTAGDKILFNIPFTEPECQCIIEYYSVDNLGNTEATVTKYVHIDNTAPTTSDEFGTPYLYYDMNEYITPTTNIYLNATDLPNCGEIYGCGVQKIMYDYGTGWLESSGDKAQFTIPDDCEHTIRWYAVDNLENQQSQLSRVVDVDGTAPIVELSDDEITLWPPNHKYHTIEIDDIVESVVDNKLPVTDVIITSVSSDEPENYLDDNGDDEYGDGDTWDDIVIENAQLVKLRAERLGDWNGRVYQINFEVSDLIGNQAIGSFQIFAPICPKCEPVDDGPGEGYVVLYS